MIRIANRKMRSDKQKVFHVAAKIPKGKVLTYQDVAQLASVRSPRLVGNLLHLNKDPIGIPCHRVVHKDGRLAQGYRLGGIKKQKERLEKEGIIFKNDRVNLEIYLWKPI